MRIKGDYRNKARPIPNAKGINIFDLYKRVGASSRRRSQFDYLVKELNQYLKNRYSYKTNPVDEHTYFTIDARRAAFRLYLRFKPENAEDSLVVVNAIFRQKNISRSKVVSETLAFLDFLIQQSETCKFNELKLEHQCGIPQQIIKTYGFNLLPGEGGWQIPCDEIKLNMSKTGKGKVT